MRSKKISKYVIIFFLLTSIFSTFGTNNLSVDILSKKRDNPIFISALEDNYEENDYVNMAYNLSLNADRWLSTINGTGFQWDLDYYEIYVHPGYEHLVVNLTFTHVDGDISLQLYNATYDWINDGVPDSSTDNETYNILLPSSGTYFLEVGWGDEGNAYDLWWNAYDLSGIPQPKDEEPDPNDEEPDPEGSSIPGFPLTIVIVISLLSISVVIIYSANAKKRIVQI